MKYPAQSDIWRLNEALRKRPVGVGGRSRVLGVFHQVFPVRLLPDELLVEELRIVWIKRLGPWARDIISIMATDIACVNAASGPFFGHVHIKSLTGGPEILVDVLARGDVYQIRSLVEGIALASREGLKVEGVNLETEKGNILRAGRVMID